MRKVVVALLRPLDDRSARWALAAGAGSELWAWLAGHPVVIAQPVLREWGEHRSGAGPWLVKAATWEGLLYWARYFRGSVVRWTG
jgi:hypothetical protein